MSFEDLRTKTLIAERLWRKTRPDEISAGLYIRARVDNKWKMVTATDLRGAVYPQGRGRFAGRTINASGNYYVRLQCDGKNRWLPVGPYRDAAITRRAEIKARIAKGDALESVGVQDGRVISLAGVDPFRGGGIVRVRERAEQQAPLLAEAIQNFLQAKSDPKRADLAQGSLRKYEFELLQFAVWSGSHGVRRVEDIVSQVVVGFADWRDQHGNRTRASRHNTMTVVSGFVRWYQREHGLPVVSPLGPDDLPRIETPEPEAYSDDELERLYAASTEHDRLVWRFLALTGLRENEAVRLEWRDLDLERGVLIVRPHEATHKRQHYRPEHRIKDRERRQVPIEGSLGAELAAYRQQTQYPDDDDLVFAYKGGTDGHLLRRLKITAKRAGIASAYLHKFRSTFISRLILGTDIDPLTVAQWAGHSDLSITIRHYLARRDAGSQRARDVIARAFGSGKTDAATQAY